MKKWCHNSYTGEIFSYEVSGNLTDFPRGQLLAYGDALTTEISSKERAEEWAKEYGYCPKCDKTVSPLGNGKCRWCKVTDVEFREEK